MRLDRFVIALVAVLMGPLAAKAQIISITIAPPVLPVYEQPPIPAPGYIWTPGYWAYGVDGYFWVPGTWVQPPAVGLLWTPGYWGWRDGVYAWNVGYWGPRIGFYGGVNYGFGYGGVGYEGGHWDNGVFAYNRTVNNFGGVSVTNVYNKTVINNVNVTRVSFNGGTGGTAVQPTAQEQAAAQDRHVAPAAMQTQQEHLASTNRALLASENHGHPAIAATSRAGEFTGKGVVAAHEAKPGFVPPSAPGAKPLPVPAAASNAPPNAAAKAAAAPANAVAGKPSQAAPSPNKPVANNVQGLGAPGQPHATTGNAAPPAAPAKPMNPVANPAARPVAQAPRPAVAAAAAKPLPHPAAPPAAHPAPRQQVAAVRHPAPRPAPHPPARSKAPPHPEGH